MTISDHEVTILVNVQRPEATVTMEHGGSLLDHAKEDHRDRTTRATTTRGTDTTQTRTPKTDRTTRATTTRGTDTTQTRTPKTDRKEAAMTTRRKRGSVHTATTTDTRIDQHNDTAMTDHTSQEDEKMGHVI